MSILSEEKDQRLTVLFFDSQVSKCVPHGEIFRLIANQFLGIQSWSVVNFCNLKNRVEIEIVSNDDMPAGYHEPTDTTRFFPWKIISSAGEFYFSGVYPVEPHTCEGDFQHFISDSGLSNDPPEVIQKMRLAFAAAWEVENE